jgi:hypothetical protein
MGMADMSHPRPAEAANDGDGKINDAENDAIIILRSI